MGIICISVSTATLPLVSLQAAQTNHPGIPHLHQYTAKRPPIGYFGDKVDTRKSRIYLATNKYSIGVLENTKISRAPSVSVGG